jgi:predicted glycogen debranching enzyme
MEHPIPSRTVGRAPDPPSLAVPREVCHELGLALTREWVETDGRGGYASSTILNCPTRRYHGLLVTTPPGLRERHVFLAGFDERLCGEGKSFPLSVMRYPGLWHPHGHDAMESFHLAPYPVATLRIGRAVVQRAVLMARARPAVLVRWTVSGYPGTLELVLRPLFACRRADALTLENLALNPRFRRLAAGLAFQPYDALPATALAWSDGVQEPRADPVWFRNVEYARDIARGYDGREDLFSPALLTARIPADGEFVIAASLGAPVADPAALWHAESAARRAQLAAAAPGPRGTLAVFAGDLLQRTPAPSGRERLGAIAGLPWFGEWGRDTFVSLPGLTLARGAVEECGAALEAALEYLDGGLLPNIFGSDRASSHYGSADASLWFARAVLLYERAGGAPARLHGPLLAGLLAIAEAYRDGTGLGIGCDESGLVRCGGPGLNATWMDARIDGVPVTPRDGFPVEVNALWYQMLGHVERLLETVGRAREAATWRRLRRHARVAFLARFWREDDGWLADVWRADGVDASVRPNAVIAAAQEMSPLSREKRVRIVRRAKRDLVTPRGLRTLAPRDPLYRGRYEGGPRERDLAYHQGTVWPWLLGFYCEASLRAFGPSPRLLADLAALLDGFGEHLEHHGLGHVAEVFDGDAPHRPGGAIAQAWSEAELLRAWALLAEARA